MSSLQCWLTDKWARFPLDSVSWLTTNSRSWTITSFAASPSWHGCEWRSINYFTKASSKPTTCVSLSIKSHCTKVPLNFFLSKRSGMKFFQNIKVAKFLFLPNVLILSEIKVNTLPLFNDTQTTVLAILKAPTRTSSKDSFGVSF